MKPDLNQIEEENQQVSMRAVCSKINNMLHGTCMKFLTLIPLWIILFYPALSSLFLDWYRHSDYSYGFIIPFISGYLVWIKREKIRDVTIEPTIWGFPLLCFGLILYTAGVAGSEPFTQRISIVVTLLGMIHFLGGGVLLRQMVFPVGYLFLMIPMPYVIFKSFAFYLRLLNARISTDFIQLFGIPVFHESYFLHLPGITLEVADVCSGLLSLISLLAIGTVYAYRLMDRWYWRLILCLSIIPIVIISNSFRISAVAILVYYFGDIVLKSYFHIFHGTVNFLLSLILFWAVGNLLTRFSKGLPLGKVK